MKYLIIVFMLNAVLIENSFSKEKVVSDFAHEAYSTAQQKFQDRNWKQAIMQLEELNNHYPFGVCSQQVQLNLIYAYYKNNDLLSSQVISDRFMHMNPTHPNIDYVIYMHGLANMALDNNTTLKFLGFNFSDRDPKYAHSAFNDFLHLLNKYPNSKYVADASKRLVFLKNRLANLEYSIADYYAHRGAWVAVVHRIEDMLHNYPDTQATYNGLMLMANAYHQMHMNAQADKVLRIIAINTTRSN